MAWYETGIRSFVIRWICPAPPCACSSADTFCCCYSDCVCCCCCYGLENRKRKDDMVADPDAAFSFSTTPTSHAKTLPSSPSHATIQNPQEPLLACLNKKNSLIYWIRGGRFVCSFRNLWQHLRNQRPFFQTQLENAGECRGLRCLFRASQRNPNPRR